MMALRLARPGLLVDVNGIAELKFIAVDAGVARIGAATRQCVAERDAALAASVPLIRQALAWVGHIQTRNRGTIGGSLAHADPAAELPLVALVLGATLQIRASDGVRSLSAEQFFTGAMATALEPHECLQEIAWPVWRERRTGSAFTEIGIRHGDFAIVAAAAQVALDDSGVCLRAAFGLGGVGATPMAFPQVA